MTGKNMPNPNLIVITGAPGAGKTTLLNILATLGFSIVPEAARQIIQEQQTTNSNALPWADTTAYIKLMLDRSISSFLQYENSPRLTFFDRGLPDTLGYAHIIKLTDPSSIQLACNQYRYSSPVFVAPPWREIYTTDSQRKQTYEEAIESFQHVVTSYHSCGYKTHELPQASPEDRADFVLNQITQST
jgi:predicted ATPase